MSAGGEARTSESVLEIDLGAIVANWRHLKSRLAPGCDCAGVVKADAYGLGAAQVAPALAAAGCRRFFVAQLAEGLRLRGVLRDTCEIFVLAGLLGGEEPEYLAAGLVPVLNDRAQLERWAHCAERLDRPLPAALHLDTGMSRLGLEPADVETLAANRAALRGVALRLVLSHLARSEEDVAMNAEQLALFGRLAAAFPGVPRSLANSSGIFLGPDFHFNLARPGAALYGINPLPGRPNPQAPVARLHAKILQLRDIVPPRSVGYGATFVAARPTRVATVALGYADGWLRSLSGRGHAWHAGRRLDFIGRVSMDLITLDVSAAPDLKPGDTVEMLGANRPVDEVADEAGTNGYEVLTRLGRRFARRYVPA